jgi:CRP-like cAMP-binding protein
MRWAAEVDDVFKCAGVVLRAFIHRRNSVIFAQADRADAMYYLSEGRVKLMICSPSGHQVAVAILGPGDYFGECALLPRSFHHTTAVALTNCSIVRIEHDTALRLLDTDLRFALRFRGYLVERIIRLEDHIAQQMMHSAEKRLACLLLLLAEPVPGDTERVLPRVSHEMMAEMIGTTRSRVTVLLNKFRRQGHLSHRRGSVVVHASIADLTVHPRD